MSPQAHPQMNTIQLDIIYQFLLAIKELTPQLEVQFASSGCTTQEDSQVVILQCHLDPRGNTARPIGIISETQKLVSRLRVKMILVRDVRHSC
jgi:hypothetical protein